MPLFWLVFSYLLGSVPFGFLISKLSGKDILKIGWRKTSGSNVFKNVGKWQGALTGFLDVFKGYLVVLGAQKLGLPLEIQIFSGVAAITGHNWSCFLKFAGGRGIGTFLGAFFALAPQILGFSLIPLALFALIWNAAIGTLLFLATAIFISIYFNQFETGGVFTVISLAPILIKRLGPIADLVKPRLLGREEIQKASKKAVLIKNRLIFDNDQGLMDLRIKRIFKKVKSNPEKIKKIAKPLATPIILPPKIGWKVAKLGVKIARKPIEKLLSRESEKVVLEIRVEDFKKMMIASAKKIVLHQEEINKINVFPVADKDTGYNLAATLLGVEGAISPKDYLTLRELTKDIKEAAMINARGNAGMIYTGYIIEVLDRIKHLKTVDAFHLSLAMKRGIKAARLSIAEPVEGTILDVIKAAGDKSYEVAKLKKEKNIIKILEEAYRISEVALKETKEKLEVLKKNDVVDAGALGFVKVLEAWIENLKGISPTFKPEIPSPPVEVGPEEKLKYRYEIVASFKKPQKKIALKLKKEFPGEGEEINLKDLKREFSSLGDSLDIVELENRIKLHIHTDQPEKIKNKLKDLPGAEFRIEDMEKQIAPQQILRRGQKRPLGLIVDQIADLPKEFLEKYQIETVPFATKFPDGEFLSEDNLYLEMREAVKTGKPLPITSAPPFAVFLSAYQKALAKFEKILVITVSSKLSGTYSSARIARSTFKKPEKLDITVFDCFTAEVAEGLVAIKTQELISQGKNLKEILNELKKFCPKVKLLACIDDFKYVVHGGRFKLPKILIPGISLIQKTRIRPIIGVENGKVKFLGVRFGKDIAKILAEEVDRQRKNAEIRIAIAQADNPKAARELKEILDKKPKIKVLFISSVSPVVGVHAGPGTLIVAFYPVQS
jgi:acyl-phosphate glycerol 3-phosphate acyltransferase